ncbi:MAG: DUF3329 domain-containing protein [Myxococcales bacterium]|nr:DUF3329 domain-containing protein [Myxococcales bacterium]
MQSSDFLAPLWRRVAFVVLALMWLGVELWRGGLFWALVAGALLALAVFELLARR